MRFTDEQLRAIEMRGKSLLLSAAAGSGKTATLVERIMRLVQEGADVDRMLVVTFTRAAAAGMREKLSRALGEQAALGDQLLFHVSAGCPENSPRIEKMQAMTGAAELFDSLRWKA